MSSCEAVYGDVADNIHSLSKRINSLSKKSNLPPEKFKSIVGSFIGLTKTYRTTYKTVNGDVFFDDANDFVRDVTLGKHDSLNSLVRNGTPNEIDSTLDRITYTTRWMIGASEDVDSAVSNVNTSEAFMNLTKYMNGITRDSLKKHKIAGPVQASAAGGVELMMGDGKLFTLLPDTGRLFRMHEPINRIYKEMSEISHSFKKGMNSYLKAIGSLFEQSAVNKGDAYFLNKYAYLMDFQQVPGIRMDGSQSKKEMFNIVRRHLIERLGTEDNVTDKDQVEAIWRGFRKMQPQWNLLNYGVEDPRIGMNGKPITKSFVANPANLRTVTVTSKDKTVSAAPMLHMMLYHGNKLAKMAEVALSIDDSISNKDELQSIVKLFDDESMEDENKGFRMRMHYVPTGKDDDMDAFSYAQDHKVKSLISNPDVFHSRQKMADLGYKGTLTDNVVRVAKSLNHWFESRSRYVGYTAMDRILNRDADKLVRANSTATYSLKYHIEKHMESIGNVRTYSADPRIRAISAGSNGVLAAITGTILSGSSLTNLQAGIFNHMTESEMFGKDGKLNLVKRYNTALKGEEGINAIAAKAVSTEYEFHRSLTKESEQIYIESSSNLAGAKKHLVDIVAQDAKQNNVFGKALHFLLEGAGTAKKVFSSKESFWNALETLGNQGTRLGEFAVNRFLGLSEAISFNKSENRLIRSVGEAWVFDQVSRSLQMWEDAYVNEHGKLPSSSAMKQQAHVLVDKFSLDTFNRIKSNQGDWNTDTRPLWADGRLRNPETAMDVLGGTLLTSLYVFKHPLTINMETMNKLTHGVKSMFRGNSELTKHTAVNVSGTFALMAFGLYQLLGFFMEDEEGYSPVPIPRFMQTASPFNDAMRPVKWTRGVTGLIYDSIAGTPMSTESRNWAIKFFQGKGKRFRDLRNFLTYSTGIIGGQGFRGLNYREYESMDIGNVVKDKFSLDLGYNFFKTVLTGVGRRTKPGDYSFNTQMSNALNKNWFLFNRSNDFLRVGQALAFGTNQLQNYFRTGMKENGYLKSAVNNTTNELLNITGMMVPMRYKKKRYSNWEEESLIRQAIWKRERLEAQAKYERRYGKTAATKELKEFERMLRNMRALPYDPTRRFI